MQEEEEEEEEREPEPLAHDSGTGIRAATVEGQLQQLGPLKRVQDGTLEETEMLKVHSCG